MEMKKYRNTTSLPRRVKNRKSGKITPVARSFRPKEVQEQPPFIVHPHIWNHLQEELQKQWAPRNWTGTFSSGVKEHLSSQRGGDFSVNHLFRAGTICTIPLGSTQRDRIPVVRCHHRKSVMLTVAFGAWRYHTAVFAIVIIIVPLQICVDSF